MPIELVQYPSFWLVTAAVLAGLELLISAYLFLSFGLSALATAALVVVLPDSILTGQRGLTVILLFWTAGSLLIWLVLSRRFAKGHKDKPDINDFSPRVEGTDSAQNLTAESESSQQHRSENHDGIHK